MRPVLTIILPLLLAGLTSAYAAPSLKSVIPVKYVPSYTLESYLNYYLFSKVPLKQLKVDRDSNRVSILGTVVLDLRRLPLELQVHLKNGLEQLVAGERQLPGVEFDFSKAKMSVLDAESERLAEAAAAEKRAVTAAQATTQTPEEQPKSTTVPGPAPDHGRSYDDMDVNGFPWGCANFLKI